MRPFYEADIQCDCIINVFSELRLQRLANSQESHQPAHLQKLARVFGILAVASILHKINYLESE